MTRESQETIQQPKTLLIAIETPYNRSVDMRSYFEEFANLVKTNGIEYEEIIEVRLRSIDAGTFLTKGHLESIAALCEEKKIEEVIISEPLTALQERNLNKIFGCTIFDRTQLILEIFEKAALSAEGKTQVAIAMLQHKKSRVSGKGIHLAQQSGVKGMRAGAGETAKEKELRHIEEHILKFKRQLEKIQLARDTQRKQRLDRQIPHVCLIGYTNAGKSTILNALTKSDVLAADRPFVTLDTTTRELYINHEKKGVISDTVGFIQQLPHRLIEAFKSTLQELSYADLLIHVVDVSDKNWPAHIKVVHDILAELNVKTPMLYVFNKIDRLTTPLENSVLDSYQPHVITSAQSKNDLEPLIAFLDSWKK
jgi:GTPase